MNYMYMIVYDDMLFHVDINRIVFLKVDIE